MSDLANSLDTAHKLHTLRKKWAQVDSSSGPHLITSSPPLQICSQNKVRWQRTSLSFSSSSLGLSVLVLDFLWSTAGLLFSRARAWACCEISCWNMTLRSVAETQHWDQLLKHDTEISCWNRTLRSVAETQHQDQLLKHDTEISCWNMTLRSVAETCRQNKEWTGEPEPAVRPVAETQHQNREWTMNRWAWACCETSCWNTTSEQGMNHEPVSLSLLWDQLLKHNIRTGNEP